MTTGIRILQLQPCYALGDRDLYTEPRSRTGKTRLHDIIAGRPDSRLQNTKWIVGEARALFEAIRERGTEGIVAKRLRSRYMPGRRKGGWMNVKVPGYATDRADWFRHTHPAPAC